MKSFSRLSFLFFPGSRFLFLKEGYRAGASLESQQTAYRDLMHETARSLKETRDSFNPFEGESQDLVFDGGRDVLISTFLAQRFGEPTDSKSWRNVSLHPKTFFILDQLTQLGYRVNRPENLQGLILRIENDGRVYVVRTPDGTFLKPKTESVESLKSSDDSQTDVSTPKPVLETPEETRLEFVSNDRCVIERNEKNIFHHFILDGISYPVEKLFRYWTKSSDGTVAVVAPSVYDDVYLVDEPTGHVWEVLIDGDVVSGFYAVDELTTHERAIVRIGEGGKQKMLISKYSSQPWTCEIHDKKYDRFRDIIHYKDSFAVEIEKDEWYLVSPTGDIEKVHKKSRREFVPLKK
jgi:hypothetical protein